MITTSHIIVNTALLGRKEHPERNWFIVVGSFFPDLPTAAWLFYPLFRYLGTHVNFFLMQRWTDWSHSIPLAVLGLFICWSLKETRVFYFFAGALLHDLEDLPLHAQYVHREFLPLSNYVFHSPISYWEQGYHAAVIAPIEWAIVCLCAALIWRRGVRPWAQIALLFVVIFQGVLLLYYTGFHWWIG